jgi:hypothetical protein
VSFLRPPSQARLTSTRTSTQALTTSFSTVYPSPLLTTSYPESRLSSACSCISAPVITKTLTNYVVPTQSATCNAFPNTPSGYTLTFDEATLNSQYHLSEYGWPTNDPCTLSFAPGELGGTALKAVFGSSGTQNVFRYINLIPGATYEVSMRTFATTDAIVPKIQLWGGSATEPADKLNLVASTAVLNAWQTTTGTFTANIEGQEFTFSFQGMYGSDNYALLDNVKFTLKTPSTRNAPKLAATPIVLAQVSTGESPLPKANVAYAGDGPSYAISFASPGYGGAAYSRKIDFPSSAYDREQYQLQAINPVLPDYDALWVAKMRLKSTGTDLCVIQMASSAWYQRRAPSGCSDGTDAGGEWEEVVTLPMKMESYTQFQVHVWCYSNGAGIIHSKIWLDDLRLYQVLP